jgi:hypothetical protein
LGAVAPAGTEQATADLSSGLLSWREQMDRCPNLWRTLSRKNATVLPFLPNFQYHIIDLSRYSDDEIRGTILLRVTLLLFKYVLREDLREHLPEILNLLNQLADQRTGLEYLETALRYLYHGAKAVTLADLRSAVEQVFRE